MTVNDQLALLVFGLLVLCFVLAPTKPSSSNPPGSSLVASGESSGCRRDDTPKGSQSLDSPESIK